MLKTKAERRVLRMCVGWGLYLAGLSFVCTVWGGIFQALGIAFVFLLVTPCVVLAGMLAWRWSEKWINEGE